MKNSGASSISSGRIDVAASARRVEVDNRISLKFYFRIADNIMKQADVFRDENNVIDLYIMLLRFSSLVSETIPCHLDYKVSTQSKKIYLRKRLIHALNELENLKPTFEQENNKLAVNDIIPWKDISHGSPNHSVERLLNKSKNNTAYQVGEALSPTVSKFSYNGVPHQSLAEPLVVKYNKLSLSFPNPKEETLSRHSILGPNGLHGQWQLPRAENFVRYPNSIDLSPVQLMSLEHTGENTILQDVECNSKSTEATGPLKTNSSDMQIQQVEAAEASTNDKIISLSESPSMISFDTELPIPAEIIRQPSPPPIIAEVQTFVPNLPCQTFETQAPPTVSTPDELDRSGIPIELHFSSKLMDAFMKLAKSNTDKNLETCGILAGSLKNRKFFVTALIVPKQESTSDTCHTTNEEEIFEVQDKRSLFPLGWIHTHPTQSCFMSSVDLHTHYSYQTMMPEAIAIVMAPRDSSKKHGIFRLTSPAGMSVIKHCHRRGFHHHDPPPDGNSIYEGSSHVFINPSVAFDVIDLR